MVSKICVVGAGVMGLASAVNIQSLLPRAQVTIIADKFAKDTTSDGAAGVFRPTTLVTKAETPELLKKWSQDSWDFYNKIYSSDDAHDAGISMISGFHFFDKDTPAPTCKDMVFNFRWLEQSEMKRMGYDRKCGYFITTLLIEARWYMPYLMRRFKENGGTVFHRTISSIEELQTDYDLVVNCCGLRSGTLVPDKAVYPSRGQMVRVQAPWLKHFMYDEVDGSLRSYVIPCRETVCVGGLKDKGSYDVESHEEKRLELMRNATAFVPALEGARFSWDWTGLRPQRDPVRLRLEVIRCSSGARLPVVHNYGQGSNGIALSWGCGVHTASLVADHVKAVQSKL